MSSAEQVALQVYSEAADFFGKMSLPYGYKILYGPPHHRPPVLFMGYQPGGNKPEPYEKDRWPAVSEYATENWPLGRKMRGLFDQEFLAECSGLNAIFVRAPSADAYRREFKETLGAIEKFCMDRVHRLVRAMDPQKIVVIGFAALNLFGSSKPILSNSAGRVLVREGRVAGWPALATLHLSGARISAEDLNSIKTVIAS
jgi:hypothetical protein